MQLLTNYVHLIFKKKTKNWNTFWE